MRHTSLLLVAAGVLVACSGGSSDTTPSTAGQTTGVTSVPTSDPETTTTTAVTTTTVVYPTTTVHAVPADCDSTAVLASVDAALGAARLAPGGGWRPDGSLATPFDAITQDAEEFRYRMGLDCLVRAAQQTAAGDLRLVIATWTGNRWAYAVQTTDAPATPFRADQRMQLMVEIAWGEWIEPQFVWAGTLNDGRSIVIGTADAPLAVAAKAWPADVPRFDDLPVTNAAQRYGIDALLQAGARNVSVAEPAEVGSEVAAIQLITPLGLHLVATVAPPEWFDPAAPIIEGEMVVIDAGGVDVYVTSAAPGSYAVGSVGWHCGAYVWFIDSSWGSVDELVAWARTLIDSAGCAA